ncbi:barstar family protein [Rhodococcus sp. ARC_M6]|uniref:barstar family protein n=1 Tax=Rhodococcus sp. ARC_M6 TaxID=2928852 RepID=UPI001FB5018D|nr:barstar family protein [Rhodococcus sp. ARC_M6]MCJ0906264.1 barstar family protein [Rhodococcus sp. ARC_M6]
MSDQRRVDVDRWLDPVSDVTSVAVVAEPARLDELARDLRTADYVVRIVRGARMQTISRVYDEFAAAFQFPSHFGRNKDAFDDVMRDLDDVLGLGAGFVVLVSDAELLLSGEPDQVAWFRESMDFYAEEWAPTAFRTAYQFGTDRAESFAAELFELDYPDTTAPR